MSNEKKTNPPKRAGYTAEQEQQIERAWLDLHHRPVFPFRYTDLKPVITIAALTKPDDKSETD